MLHLVKLINHITKCNAMVSLPFDREIADTILSQVQNIPERTIQLSTTGLRSQDNTHKHITDTKAIMITAHDQL